MTDDQLAARILDILILHPIPIADISIAPGDIDNPDHAAILARVIERTVTTTPSIHDLDLPRDLVVEALAIPFGDRRHLADMQAVLLERRRRRMVALALAHAAEAVNKGADPAAVLARLQDVA